MNQFISSNYQLSMKNISYFFLLFFLLSYCSFANDTITTDSIRTLSNQGNLKEAKVLVNRWLINTEDKYGKDALEVAIPLLISSELSILHYEYYNAIKDLNRAILIMDNSSGWLYPDYALALNLLTYCKLNIGETFSVLPLIDKAEMIYDKTLSQDHPDFNFCNVNRAILHLNIGDYQKSETYFKQSFSFIEKHQKEILSIKNNNTISTKWLKIQYANLYIQWYKPQQAITFLKEVQEEYIAQEKQASPIYSTLLESLANYYFCSNDYNMSFDVYCKLIQNREKYFGTDHLGTMMAYFGLGKLLAERGDWKQALEKFSMIEKFFDNEIDNENYNFKANLYLSIADVYIKKGNLNKAVEYLNLVPKKKINNKFLSLYQLRVEGDFLFLKGDYINTELKLVELVSKIRKEKIFMTKYSAQAIITLAELYITLGRLQNAITLCETEINFLIQRGMTENVYFHRLKLILIYAQLDDKMIGYTEAVSQINLIEDNITAHINTTHPLLIKSSLLKGKVAFEDGKYDDALSYLNQGIKITDKYTIHAMQYHRVKIIDLLGSIYIKKNEMEKALNEYEVLKNTFSDESLFWPSYLGRVAYIKAHLGLWEEAKKLAIQGVDIRINQYDTQLNFTSEDEKINYIYHTSEVFNYFFSLMTMTEEFRSEEMVEKCYDLQLNYRKYFLKEATFRKQQIKTLGDTRNKMKFSDYIGNLTKQKSQLATANFFSVKERHDLGINNYVLTDRINNLEKSISFASRSKNDSLNVEDHISWKDIQKKLKKKEVAIEIIKLKSVNETESIYAAIVVSSNCKTPKFIPIGSVQLLENNLFKIYNQETQPKSRSLILKRKNGLKINAYDHYWQPIQKGLNELMPSIDKIYLSKDGIYNAINLNVLFNAETKKYLIEETKIELLISTSDINKKVRYDEFKNNEICLFGNPVFCESNKINDTREVDDKMNAEDKYVFHLDNLPGTKKELENTARLFESKGWNVHTMYQKNATEENIKAMISSPTIMHIATHGIYIDELINPIFDSPLLKSGLFFTEIFTNNKKTLREVYDSGNDGILTAYEVKDLNLQNTSLLILSACQTGVSDISDGNEISGLQYAFSIAGVKSIIMSLWSVDDMVTQKLMNEFYEQWFETKDIDKAFRNAQLKMMEEYKTPYYWGGFVLVH